MWSEEVFVGLSVLGLISGNEAENGKSSVENPSIDGEQFLKIL
ncbi:hypothetical protein [Rufibacter sp. LB8]|nr:hypothetical protein [Rufibacter sp. LB8]